MLTILDKNSNYLKKDISDAIKGIALIFMFIHHFFTFPTWYIDGISYPQLTVFAKYFCEPFKICVSIFAFLTGYFYAFSKQQDFCYSLRKVTDLLISYWVVYIPMMIIAVLLNCWEFNWSRFILELFALDRPIMTFCWYIYFYCIVISLMPAIVNFSTNSLTGDICLLLLLPSVLLTVLQNICAGILFEVPKIMSDTLNNLRYWFPCIMSGFLTAKYDIFHQYFDYVCTRFKGKFAKILFFLLLICAAFEGRYFFSQVSLLKLKVTDSWCDFSINMDILYAPMFIYGLTNVLLFAKHESQIIKILGKIGKNSMYMWFTHCIFFNVCKKYTQPFVFYLRNPILVLLTALSVCYLFSLILSKNRSSVFACKKR